MPSIDSGIVDIMDEVNPLCYDYGVSVVKALLGKFMFLILLHLLVRFMCENYLYIVMVLWLVIPNLLSYGYD